MQKSDLRKAIEKALAEKGKRKFTQTVELIFNFRGVDFSKPENKLNLDVILPKGRGKSKKVAVFADQQFALDAKNAGADLVIDANSIALLGKEKKKLKKMAGEYVFLAQPNLMMAVGKSLGQVLGSRGNLPRPIVGATVSQMMERLKKSVKLATKGKNLPVAQCAIGTESMGIEELGENAEAVFDRVVEKVGFPSIKNIYVKLTMGKAIKAGENKAD
ncbi:50S ribosomal protein L1 [Candidatus Micrarchaeota archaeon CG1_02_47_40]|nr:MAG: 50S ribosomal protein L1 [Candidatus Micrarchaeota archaeon CG1_02_47_40]